MRPARLVPETIVERLANLMTTAETLADMTRAFAIERGEAAHSDLLFWVEAARNSVASHHRDLPPRPRLKQERALLP